MRFFTATCTLGLEPVLARELTELGADHVREDRGGVRFQGDFDTALRASLWVRSASRITERLFRNKPAHDREALYDSVRAFDWRGILTPDQTIAVNAKVAHSGPMDARFMGLVVKDAVCDAMRDLYGERPDVDPDTPDMPFRLIVRRGRATLVRDLVGQSLHRRGYRDVQVRSPLNEAIAAGLLLLTDWDRRSPLVDPMCGSGTFAIEAAHLATDRAPGIDLQPAALSWPAVDPTVWTRLVEEARDRHAAARSACPPILGADHHDGALGIADRSVRAAGVADLVELRHSPVTRLVLDDPPGVVVANPPWGERLDAEDHEAAWRDLGTFLKTQCGGATAWLLSGAPELTRALRLRAATRHPVMVGPIDCRWIRYDMVARGQPVPG